MERVLKSGDYSGLQEECLTDTWIGKDRFSFFHAMLNFKAYTFPSFCLLLLTCCTRWAFIDLSAGPFSWGPAVGGEGVRTEASLPNVEKTIGSTSGSNDACGLVHASACVCYRSFNDIFGNCS